MSEIDSILENCIDNIWKTYDKDKNGFLNMTESKKYVKDALLESGKFS